MISRFILLSLAFLSLMPLQACAKEEGEKMKTVKTETTSPIEVQPEKIKDKTKKITDEDFRRLSFPLMRIEFKSDPTPIYAGSSDIKEPISTQPKPSSLSIAADFLSKDQREWVPVCIEHLGQGKCVPGWVKTDDVVLPTEYKKVIGCWPVKKAFITQGEIENVITFKTDGSFDDEEYSPDGTFDPGKGYVSMGYDIVIFSGDHYILSAVYDFDKNQLVEDEYLVFEQELFSPEELRGCSGPVLEK